MISNEVNPKIKELNNLLIAGKIKLAVYRNYIDGHIHDLTCSNCERKVNPTKYKKLDKKDYFTSALCNKCQVHFFRKTI